MAICTLVKPKEDIMKKRIFHLSFYIVIFLFIVIFMSIECFGGGTYYVDQDGGGIYFQTDNDGGWYIDARELKHFKIGETGTYLIGRNRNGTFLRTDKNRKFYLDINAKEKQEAEDAKVNREYERSEKLRRQQEIKKKAQMDYIKAQEREAEANRELIREIEEKRLEAEERMNRELIKSREQTIKQRIRRSQAETFAEGQSHSH
jgi:hypothetical protein